MESSDAFRLLQPICVSVCRERSVGSVIALNDALDAISDDESIQRLQEYILFPLKLVLKLPTLQQSNCNSSAKLPLDQVVESCIQCVRTVLKRTSVNSIETAVELFTSLLGVLGHPKNGGRVDVGVSEERKETVVLALETLVRNCDENVRLLLCTVDFLPLWGHVVATFLSLAEVESASSLVVAALRALVTTVESLPSDEASVCFATFLPGVVVTCLKLLTRDEKQNHRVNCEASHLLTRSVCLVLSDEDGRQAAKNEVWKRLNPPSDTASSPKSSLLIEPTTEWRSQTWEKVGLVVNKVCRSASSNHPHWKVRLEVLTLIHSLITKCRREDYEKHCTNALVELTVSRLNDDNVDVRQLASKIVEHLKRIDDEIDRDSGRKFLREAAVESLRQTTLNLPRVFRQASDVDKLRHVRAMKGYLTVLGERGLRVSLLSSPSLVNKILLAFLQVLEMDVDDLKIIQRLPSNTLNTFADAHESFKPRIRFQLFNDEKITTVVEECLRMLGRFCKEDLFALCDPLLDNFLAKDADNSGDVVGNDLEKQAVFILNQILLGSGEDGKKKKASSVVVSFVRETLLSLYLSNSLLNAQCEPDPVAETKRIEYKTEPLSRPSLFMLDSETTETPLSAIVSPISVFHSLPKLNSNILLVSLCLEGISFCAKTLKASFRPLLIKSLYPVVEKVASEITLVQDAAFAALKQMAVGCGYDTVGELLLRNSDYVVNSLRFELRHNFLLCDAIHSSRKSSDAPRVLSAMLKNAGPELLPMLKDTVEEVLDCLDTSGKHQPENTKIFLNVLSALVFYIKQWFGKERNNAESEDQRLSSEAENSKEYWEEYLKNLRITETLDVDENDYLEEVDDEYGEAEMPTLEDPPPPYHVVVTEDVMKRCIYHMPDENPRIRVLVLDVVQNCCLSLADHENTLLPLAHQSWSSLVCRLKDKDRLVALKAFETLVIFSRTCGDFLLQRFSKDVVPALSTYMTSQGLVSAGLTTKAPKSAGLLAELADDKKCRKSGENPLGSGGAYRFTVAYKLQLAVLKGIGELCRTIKFEVATGLDKVIDWLILHLRLSQPIEFQDAAKDALVDLGTVDPDLVWLRLSSLRGDFVDDILTGGDDPGKTDKPVSDRLNDALEPNRHRRGLEHSPEVLSDIIRNLSYDDDS